MQSFQELGLNSALCSALGDLQFTQPTEIQAKAIPLLLQSHAVDFLGQAQTGTGKTLAFGLPLLQRIQMREHKVQAIVVAPTRELAQQIYDSLKQVNTYTDIRMALLYGGMSMESQIRALRQGVQIIIGTPGRIQDHLKRKTLLLQEVNTVVLDEADIMLDMGFKEDVEAILQYITKHRSIWLFSATVKSGIQDIIRKHMNNVQSINMSIKQVNTAQVMQYYTLVDTKHRFAALCRFIDVNPGFYGFVFTPTKVLAGEVADQLNRLGYKAGALHGDMSQVQRNRMVEQFKKRDIAILVATDVAARGIDIPDISHVINYSLPEDLESYVHRVGRTGRAGKQGTAITFVNQSGVRRIRLLEKRFQGKISHIDIPNYDALIQLQVDRAIQILQGYKNQPVTQTCMKPLSAFIATLTPQEMGNSIIALVSDMFFKHIRKEEDTLFTKQSKQDHFDNEPQEELTIYQGSDDGIQSEDIMSFLVDIAQIAKHDIKKIKVLKRRSFVVFSADQASSVAQLLKNKGLHGKKVRVSVGFDDGQFGQPTPHMKSKRQRYRPMRRR